MSNTYFRRSKPHLKLVSDIEKPKVLLTNPKFRKPKNSEVRSREYLREDEVNALIEAAKSNGRHCLRDGLMILMQYRHGLRVTELCRLRWDDVDWGTAHIYIKRIKNGKDSNQPIEGTELRLLRQFHRQELEKVRSPFMFLNERKSPMDDERVRQIVARAGELAGFNFPVHPHMLRHGCGFYLASKGYDTRIIQDYLGHVNIQHTVIYTQLAPGRFSRLWE